VSAALRCFYEAEQGAATPRASVRRRPKLYLASSRRSDGSVITYDPLKQIIEVKDDKHNLTQVAYDHLGRRTSIDNPDTGRTETQYDLASNVSKKITATLKAKGEAIAYAYDYNRLKSISYPSFPGNNIAYEYGAAGTPDNRAGRIAKVTSQAGAEERSYGKLGELTKEINTIASATQGNSVNSPEVYTTQYRYDTFGRLKRLTYPDAEVLTYDYDAGGNLKKATGIKAGYSYDYLKRLEYDRFEQRQFLEAGNNIRTRYTYDDKTRRLKNLKAYKGEGNPFQNLAYGYDPVGNVLSLKNEVPVAPPNQSRRRPRARPPLRRLRPEPRAVAHPLSHSRGYTGPQAKVEVPPSGPERGRESSRLTYHAMRNSLNGDDPLLPRPPDRGPVQRPGRAAVPDHRAGRPPQAPIPAPGAAP